MKLMIVRQVNNFKYCQKFIYEICINNTKQIYNYLYH